MNPVGQKKELSVLLPVYNEASQIENCIRKFETVLRRFSRSFEIIVSEDGSTDGTADRVGSLSASDPNLCLLHSSVRLGKGAAVKKAVAKSNGDIVVFADADLAANLEYLPMLLQSVRERGGLAIASRLVKGSVVRRRTSRTFFSLAYNIFVRLLFFDGIHDHQCGFKAMSREASKVVLETKSNGFFFDTELILRCRKQGFAVVEIGVEWTESRGNGKSKIKVFRDAEKIGLDLLKYRLSSQ